MKYKDSLEIKTIILITACFDSTESCMSLIYVTELSVLFDSRVPAVVVTSGLFILGVILLCDLGPVHTGLTLLGHILSPHVDPLSILAIIIQSDFTIFFRSCICR